MSVKETKVEKAEKPESIRQWYERTTGQWRKGLWAAAGATVCVMGVMWATADLPVLQRIQTFNGALTIPMFGGLWVLSFIFMFLVPSREASFRSQESIEQTIELLSKAIDEKVSPAMDQWKALGLRLQGEIDGGLLKDFKEAIIQLKDTAQKIQASADTSNGEIKKFTADAKQFTDDARPAIQALQRIQDRFEKEVNGGLLDEIRTAMDSIRQMSLPSSATGGPVVPKEPKLDKALGMISKKPAASAPAVVKTSPIPPPTLVAKTPAPAATPAAVPVQVPVTVVETPPAPVEVAAPPSTASMPIQVSVMPTQAMHPPVQMHGDAIPPTARFAPAPAPTPVAQAAVQRGMTQPAPQVPVAISPSPMKAPETYVPRPEVQAPRQTQGEIDLPLIQKHRPVVVTPVAPPQFGVNVPSNGPVAMVTAPQVIRKSEG